MKQWCSFFFIRNLLIMKTNQFWNHMHPIPCSICQNFTLHRFYSLHYVLSNGPLWLKVEFFIYFSQNRRQHSTFKFCILSFLMIQIFSQRKFVGLFLTKQGAICLLWLTFICSNVNHKRHIGPYLVKNKPKNVLHKKYG